MHMTRPDQERIGRVRCALIAVAAPFYDEAQIVFAGKIYGGSDVVGVSCSDGVDTRFGGPGVNPAQGLGYAGVVANVVGVFQHLRRELCSPRSATRTGMRSLGTRPESGCRQLRHGVASMLPSRASRSRKDALAESWYWRTRCAATAAKVILPRTPSKTLFGSRLLPAFPASFGDYFSVVDRFNHDSPCEARARFRHQSQPEALPVATLKSARRD